MTFLSAYALVLIVILRCVHADPLVPMANKCVFVLGTGRSGSTSLVDALNQIPHYFIRMEQEAAFHHLFMSWRMLEKTWNSSMNDVSHLELDDVQKREGTFTFQFVKSLYDRLATCKKMPWFNDLHPVRIMNAMRAFYSITYGYHGPNVVSGFKEIKYTNIQVFRSQSYEGFTSFIFFLRQLCIDAKIILNTHANNSMENNSKLVTMLLSYGMTDNDRLLEAIGRTHVWYDRYVAEHPDHAFRVLMEDMFTPKKNDTLLKNMLQFLGEPVSLASQIYFSRMPPQSHSSNKACGIPYHED